MRCCSAGMGCKLRPLPCLCERAWHGACSSMTEEEKSNLSLFGPEARQRAAAAARCSVMEVMPAYSPSAKRDVRRLTEMLNPWSGHACEHKTPQH